MQGGGADVLVGQHAEHFAEAFDLLVEQGFDGFWGAVAAGQAGAAGGDDGIDGFVGDPLGYNRAYAVAVVGFEEALV